LLDIDRDLVDNKEADIRVMFEKYVAIQSAYDKIRTIDWKARGYNKPSIKRDIIAIFIGKSPCSLGSNIQKGHSTLASDEAMA